MTLAWSVLAAVVVQRLAELVYASRNTTALLRRGGIEVGRSHYPVMVALHVAWLGAVAAGLRVDGTVRPVPLGLFLLLQPARIWVMASLGRFWTTRIVTVPGAPLVRRGPYRFLRHPNYVVVAGEIALLPLAFGQTGTAAACSAANLAVLAWRIRTENAALAMRA